MDERSHLEGEFPEDIVFHITSFLHIFEVHSLLNTCKTLQQYAQSQTLILQLTSSFKLPVMSFNTTRSLVTLCLYEKFITDEAYTKLLERATKENDMLFVNYLLENVIDKPEVVAITLAKKGKYEEGLNYAKRGSEKRISYIKKLSETSSEEIEKEAISSLRISSYVTEELVKRNEIERLERIMSNPYQSIDTYSSLLTHFIEIQDEKRLLKWLSAAKIGLPYKTYAILISILSYRCIERDQLKMLTSLDIDLVPHQVLYRIRRYADKTKNVQLLDYVLNVPYTHFLPYIKYEEFVSYCYSGVHTVDGCEMFNIAIYSKVDRREKVAYISSKRLYHRPTITQIQTLCEDDAGFDLLKEFYLSKPDFNAKIYFHSLFTKNIFKCSLSLVKWIADKYTDNLLNKTVNSLIFTLSEYQKEKRIDKVREILSFANEKRLDEVANSVTRLSNKIGWF